MSTYPAKNGGLNGPTQQVSSILPSLMKMYVFKTSAANPCPFDLKYRKNYIKYDY
jgi:hypothetical protein